MKILVCGGRTFNDLDYVYRVLDYVDEKLLGLRLISQVIEGGARGADRLGRFWAQDKQIPFVTFEAEWSKYGPSAGPRRNRQMLKEGKPDYVVSFPGNEGTMDMRHAAYDAGVPVYVFDGKSLKYDFLNKDICEPEEKTT